MKFQKVKQDESNENEGEKVYGWAIKRFDDNIKKYKRIVNFNSGNSNFVM